MTCNIAKYKNLIFIFMVLIIHLLERLVHGHTPATARFSGPVSTWYWPPPGVSTMLWVLTRRGRTGGARAGPSQYTRQAATNTTTGARRSGLHAGHGPLFNDGTRRTWRQEQQQRLTQHIKPINTSAEHEIVSVCSTQPYRSETHP